MKLCKFGGGGPQAIEDVGPNLGGGGGDRYTWGLTHCILWPA